MSARQPRSTSGSAVGQARPGPATPPLGLGAKQWLRAVAVLALAVLALTTLVAPAPASAAKSKVYRIAANGKTGASGGNWKSAGTLADLPRFVRLAAPGDEIWIRGGEAKGAYRTSKPITLNDGGAPGAPVVIRGVDFHGTDRATPTFVGTRTAPYDPAGNPGGELFRLVTGADNLEFRNLAFENQGNGAFRVAADISNLTIHDVQATNVRRFLESYPSGDARSATISGLQVSDVTVDGFSRGVIRLRDDTNDVVIRDVTGDSQRQDGDNFAMGVHLDGTVHDVLLERVTMRNSHDTTNSYWNGDGFAAERGTYDLTFVDTVATGNTDAGYDLKSASTKLVRAVAEDNKRNYRFWEEAELRDSVGRDPRKRGGSGTQANVWAGKDAQVHVYDSTLADLHSDTVVFEIDGNAQVHLHNTTVVRAIDAKESVINKGALLVRQ